MCNFEAWQVNQIFAVVLHVSFRNGFTIALYSNSSLIGNLRFMIHCPVHTHTHTHTGIKKITKRFTHV